MKTYTFEVIAHDPNGGSETFFKEAKAETREEARQQIVARCEKIDSQFMGAYSEVEQ